MTRDEALKAAADFVDASIHPVDPPRNPNGYPINGWRIVDPAERLEMVLKTAAFLLGEEA